MKTIIVKTQAELDILPEKFEEFTTIEIRSKDWITVRKFRGNSSVVARENSSVQAFENSLVEAFDNSSVEAFDNSSVEAWGNSSVKAWGNSSVVARGNSSVGAWGNSSVGAWGNSSVEAWGNSSVVAYGNSSVEAWGNSSVGAYGNSSVQVNENASVDLWDRATATGSGKINVYQSDIPKNGSVENWLASEFVDIKDDFVTLYKRVSCDYKTQEGTPNETLWKPGTTVEHPDWNPGEKECGSGKFHACSRPYFCDQFRSGKGDKYVAIKIAVKDLVAWRNPDYPHKIAFRKGEVVRECGRME